MMWLEIPLSSVLVDAQSGTWGASPTGDGNDLPVLRSTNIHNSKLVLKDIAFRSITQKAAKRYQLLNGDIIVTTSSGSKDLIGKNAMFRQPEDDRCYLFSNFTIRLRPNPQIVLPRYLRLYLNSSNAKAELLRIQSTTSGLRNLPIPLYLAQMIPLPSLSEQWRIVEILDQADEIRIKRAEVDAKAARFLPALFYEMFGDPATNPKGWNSGCLVEFGASVRYGLGQPPAAKHKGIALIRATNVKRGLIDDRDMMFVDPEDVPVSRNAFLKAEEVIVVRSGAYTGDVAQVGVRWAGAVAGYDLVVSPGPRFSGEFLSALLLTTAIQKHYFGNIRHLAGQPHLNATQLERTPVFVPPEPLKNAFSAFVCTFRKGRELSLKSVSSIETLFSILLHRAFSGDLTAKWREAHMKELLAEMRIQSKLLSERGLP
jgi:type I restriction enzyme, S subunit